MWSFKRKRVDKARDIEFPAWISRLTDAGDRQVLTSMVNKGANLEKPREMIFCIQASDENAKKIKQDAEAMGWKFAVAGTTANDAGEPIVLIDLIDDEYVISLESFERDSLAFDRLARKYNAERDGWYASTSPGE
jgi:regulator of RNase E activity RraB